jgi:hypothetical protein
MAAVAAVPIILNNVTVQIGDDTYEAACRTVRFVPTTAVVKWKGLTPSATFAFAGTPEWDVTVTFAQDIASAASLTKALHTGVGTKPVLVFEPVAGGPTVTATIVLIPGDIGGDIDTVPESSVTMPVQGQPVIAPAA